MKMQSKTNFYLVDYRTGIVVSEGDNFMNVIKSAFEVSNEQNHGLIRYWVDEKLYIDAEPRVFYIIADGDVDTNDLLDLLGGKEQC